MVDYTNPNFDITEYIGRNCVDNLKNISDYLNFAIKSTILKQIPNISKEKEVNMANKILKNYFSGNDSVFTRKDNIRNNIKKIDKKRLFDLFIKTGIIQKEINCKRNHLLADKTFDQKCVTWITSEMYFGQYDNVINELEVNHNLLDILIDYYIVLFYNTDEYYQELFENMILSNSETNKALINLNISMCECEINKRK